MMRIGHKCYDIPPKKSINSAPHSSQMIQNRMKVNQEASLHKRSEHCDEAMEHASLIICSVPPNTTSTTCQSRRKVLQFVRLVHASSVQPRRTPPSYHGTVYPVDEGGGTGTASHRGGVSGTLTNSCIRTICFPPLRVITLTSRAITPARASEKCGHSDIPKMWSTWRDRKQVDLDQVG